MKTAVAFLPLFLLGGCQMGSQPTASGSPEITVQQQKPDQVRLKLVNLLLSQGRRLNIRGNSSYQVEFERKRAGDVIERLSFSMAEIGTGTRIVVDRYIVRYSLSGRESTDPANNVPSLDDLQTMLDNMLPALSARGTEVKYGELY